MDPFYSIPSPVLLTIVKLSPDLLSLWSLVQASPVVSSLFDECASEITEAVLSSSLPSHTQTLIRAIILVHSNSCSSSNWHDFLNKYIHSPQSTNTISKSTLSHVLRGILALASQLHHVAHSCLQDLNDRCLALEPYHLLDPAFQYRPNLPIRHPLGQRYQPQDIGSPSWVEEQRVCLALWRLQLLLCLREATLSVLGWPEEDLERFQSMEPDQLWESLPSWELETVKCVHEYLCESQEQVTMDLSTTKTSQGSVRLLSRCLTQKIRYDWPTASPRDDEAGWLWGQSTRQLNGPSRGYLFLTGPLRYSPQSPLKGASFGVFRRFGFSIWDLKRLAALGFMEELRGCEAFGVVERQRFSRDNLFFTWQSIMPSKT